MTTDGRYITGKHWGHWVVLDQSFLPPHDLPGLYPTQAEAQAAADRLNTPATPQRTQQASLFDPQEASA